MTEQDTLKYPYVIFNKDHEICDEKGNESVTPYSYIDEESALTDIRHIFKDYGEDGPFYVGKITLISRVYPPTQLEIEKL